MAKAKAVARKNGFDQKFIMGFLNRFHCDGFVTLCYQKTRQNAAPLEQQVLRMGLLGAVRLVRTSLS